jgi:hypothetical protein
VFVERVDEAGQVERSALDDRPLVGEEGQALSQRQQDDRGDRGREREQASRPVGDVAVGQ